MGAMHSLASWAHLLRMSHSQWKSEEELDDIQERKLLSLFRHASTTVPYYRKTLQGKTMRCREDLSCLPPVRREAVRDTEAFTSSVFPRSALIEAVTSGSSGLPLKVLFTGSEIDYTHAQRLHQMAVAGVGPFDRMAFVNYRPEHRTLFQDLGFFRLRCLSFSDSEEKNLAAIRSSGVSILISYPSCLVPLALENLSSGSALRMKSVLSFAESLSGKARRLISRSFGCPVFDRYGAIEAGSIAWQCEKGGRHIYHDSVIVEILDDSGNPVRHGETGNVVLTPLWRYSMPLVRYWIGDKAAFGPKCRCGRALPTLASVEGRNNPFIVLPSGRLFSGTAAGIGLHKMSSIVQFQIIQERPDSLRILAIPEKKDALLKRKMAASIRKYLPEPMGISVEFVERLEQGSGGKACELISRLRP